MSDATKVADGGPAFPAPDMVNLNPQSEDYGMLYGGEGGVTVRDVFALGALAGLLSADTQGATAQDVAAASYRMADAMLAERTKENPS